MKKLKDLTAEELGALYKHNQQFANAVYEDAFQCNMDLQADEFSNMGAKVFDYHDHYSSFYLTTPMQYGVRNAHAIAHKLNDDNMSDKARYLYDELNKLADEYDNLEADELDERGDEVEERMNNVCDKLAEQLTYDFREYENIDDSQIEATLDGIREGWSYMADWETDGTVVYEHITKEYK